MSEVEEDLKATAAAVTEDARRLLEIEREKLTLDPQDERIPVLSAEAQAISQRLVVQTAIEDELATELAAEPTS